MDMISPPPGVTITPLPPRPAHSSQAGLSTWIGGSW